MTYPGAIRPVRPEALLDSAQAGGTRVFRPDSSTSYLSRTVETYRPRERLLLRRGIPVQQDRDRCGGAVEFRVDQEAPVGGDVVLPPLCRVHAATDDARRKQHDRRARFERGPRSR